jgi:MFS family permease
VGPIVGGVFTDDVTWRWCFYINLPLGAISIIGVALLLQNPAHLATKKSFEERLGELDFIGPLLFIPANVGLVLALQWGGSKYSWNSPPILGLFSIFGIFAPLWVISQVYLKEKATIPMRLMTQRTVFFSSLYAFFSGAAFLIPLFYLPQYFQAVRDTNATESAIDTLPLVISAMVSAIVTGVFLSMIGYFVPFMIFGAALVAVGAGFLSTFRVDTILGLWLGYQIIVGVGSGITAQVLSISSFLTVRHLVLLCKRLSNCRISQ